MEQGIYISRSCYTKKQAHGKVWIDGESCGPRDFSGWGHVCKISGHEDQMVELCVCERNSEKLQKWRLRSSWKSRTLGSFAFGNCVEGLVRVRAVLALWANAQLKNNFVHLFCKQEESPWAFVIGFSHSVLSPEIRAVCRDSSALPQHNSPFLFSPFILNSMGQRLSFSKSLCAHDKQLLALCNIWNLSEIHLTYLVNPIPRGLSFLLWIFQGISLAQYVL